MKRSFVAAAAMAASFTFAAVAQSAPPAAPSPAATSPAPTGATKIAVIAFQPAVASTNEGRQALAAVQQKFAPKQAQLKAESDQIDTLKKQLQAAGSTLSQEERATRLRTIDDKEKSLQRQAQDAQSDYQSAMNEAFQGLLQKFFTVLQDYATTNGYGVVLDASSQQTPIVWASKKTDITQAVVAEYNQKSGVPAPANPGTSASPHGTTTHHHAAPTSH
jgi:outer membrane protein